jgi:PAS domain S-box-containing protein
VNDPAPRRLEGGDLPLESPPASYAGRTRYTQLEYEALLANASIGIAFTRDRRFFLCNPKFAEMFGWESEELIGQPGEVVYPSSESYAALGQIAVPVLSAGKQLDLEWEVRRRNGSTFLARLVAKAIDAQNTQQGTVWIVEDITERRRQADEVSRLLREQDAILGNASIGIVFIKERRIVRCNRRYEEMYGYAPGERQADVDGVRRRSSRAGRGLRRARARPDGAPRGAAQAQGRQHVLEPRRRPRRGSAGAAQGLGVDRRGHHRAAPRRG